MDKQPTHLAVMAEPDKGIAIVEVVETLGGSKKASAAAAAALEIWAKEARGAYAENTKRAWLVDCRRFASYCRRTGQCALPALPPAVRGFIMELFVTGKRMATIRRNVSTIALMHGAAGCPNPAHDVFVKLALKTVAKKLRARQRQAHGLTRHHIERFLAIRPVTLRDYRDRALVLMCYDALCRSEELVAFNLEHVHFDEDGSATVLIERSKTDQEGEGRTPYLAPDTVAILKEWLVRAGITAGPLFRAIRGKSAVRKQRLRPPAIATVFYRLGLRIGLSRDQAERLTGHAARVGATQDALAAGIDPVKVAVAGRWQDARMVVRYGERILAKRGAMAQLAKLQGRTKRNVDIAT